MSEEMNTVPATSGNGSAPVKRIEEPTAVQIICTYIVQKLGEASIREVLETAKARLYAELDDRVTQKALNALKKRDILAQGNRQLPGGKTVKTFTMKKLAFKAPPEYAHVTDLLPELLTTVELQELKASFDKKEKKGEEKKSRGNVIDEYAHYHLRVVSTDILLGSQIPSEFSDAIRESMPNEFDEALKASKDDNAGIGIWERDPITGDYLIASDVLRGWFAANVIHRAGLAAARASYCAFSPVRIPSTAKVQEIILPVQSRTGPSAPKKYEAIIPPVTFDIFFSAPVQGFLMFEQLERLIIQACANPVRGLSPARGTRYGKLLPVSFKLVSQVKKGSLDHLAAMFPAEMMEQHGSYLREAIARTATVEVKGAAKAADLADDDDGEPEA